MKSFLIRAASVTVGVGLTCLALKPAQEQTTTSQIVSAANAFLSTLDDKQRQAVLYSFDDQEQRQRWSNFPTGMVPRGGISLKQMSEQQRAAAMQLLSIVLSPMGLEKVNEIRMADDDFKAMDPGTIDRAEGHRLVITALQMDQAVRRHNSRTVGLLRPVLADQEGPGTANRLTLAISLAAISTTSHLLANPPRQRLGCFNSAVIT